MLQQVSRQAHQLILRQVQQSQALQPKEGEIVQVTELIARQPEDCELPLGLEGPVLDPGEAVPGEVHEGQLWVELEGGGAHLLQAVLLQR